MHPTLRLIGTLALLGLSLPGQALAHGLLVQTTPVADSAIAEPPTEISLRFNEKIEVRFSGIELLGPDGVKIVTGEIALRDDSMVAPVSGPLSPGVYQVDWHVLSADGHKVEGSFKFEVGP
ncbi:copper homeostasis periplasmic binding protein CopC [Devosia sp.]|uniref:copper homeostasis periplasmic binding protein CopC n=1 Tax=Devosia sp. TaxID=1871048 RepID=UPI003F70BE6D